MSQRRGMSLVEIMIAITVLAIVVASIGMLSIGVAHKSFAVSGSSFLSAEVTRQVNRLQTLPFDSLPAEAGTIAVPATPYPYARDVAITDVTGTDRQIRLILTPVNLLFRPETLVFNRTLQPIGSPMNAQ
ncbi:MAG: prepilin-type N-terminal cleavage/methylation domain-containing protein [Gemmatimonadaceae bacterium]